MSLIKVLTLAAACFIFLLPGTVRPQDLKVQLNISPPADELRPGTQPATLALNVSGADGKAIEQGWVHVQLDAPAPGRFFSTDFPLVEGSRLFTTRLPLSDGKTEWQYLFPIRGQYRLTVEAHSADGGKAGVTFRFTVKEKGTKWLLLGAFTLALFAIGVIGGRIFTFTQAAAPIIASVFVALPVPPDPAAANLVQPAGRAQLEVGEAVVGRTTQVRWALSEPIGGREPNAALSMAITHVEQEKTVFAIDKLPVGDEFVMEFHFVDGAEYRLTANAETQHERSIHSETSVTVRGLEPPTSATMPALAFFIAVMALGIGLGRWSKKTASP